MTQPLFFRDEAGKVFEVPRDQVETANRAGLLPASQKDIDAALKREAAGTTGAAAKAFAEGLASGTLDAATAIPRAATAIAAQVGGVADPLEDMTGRGALETGAAALGGGAGTLEGARSSQRYAEEARLRAEENSGWSTAGTIGGQVLGSELGGLGALARGIGGAATKVAGGGRLARVAGSGVTGATEGAPLALVAAQDQAYIENRRLTGEMAIAAMGHGAIIGGGIGIAARGLGEAIGAGKDAVAKRFTKPATGDDAVKVAEQQFGEAAPGLRDAYARASGAVSGKDPEAIRALTAGGKGGREARRIAVYEGDAIRETAKREFVTHIDDMGAATRNLQDGWQGPLKKENVAKVISRGESSAAQVAQADAQVATIRGRLDEMLNDPIAYGQQGKLKKLDRFVALAERELGTAVETGSNEGLFVALDGLKKRMGKLTDPGRRLTVAADAEVAVEMRELYEGLRQGLEKEAVWGGAATMQNAVNEPYTRWMRSNGLFSKRFTTEVSDVAANPWERSYAADPKAAHGYIEGLTSAKNDVDHQLVRAYIKDTKDLGTALAKAGELTPEKAAELNRIIKAAEGFEATVAKAEKSLVLSNQLRALERLESGSMGELTGAAVGGMVGGPIGAAIGAVGATLKNPGLMVRRMAMIERMADKAGVSVDGSLGKLFAGIEGAGAKVKAVATAAKGAPTPTALELFQGKHATPELAYKERAREVLAANENSGQRIRDNAGSVFGSSFDADPHAVGAAVIATTKAVQLLAAKLPGGLVQHESMTPLSSKTYPSRADIQQYAQLHTAVTQPLAVIADIPKGSVTRDQIDAIAYVHPALIQHVRLKTLEKLRKLDQRGIEVPIRQRLILDSLLDIDGAGERTFSTAFAIKYQAAMSDTAATQSQGERPPPRVTQTSARMATDTETMIGGE